MPIILDIESAGSAGMSLTAFAGLGLSLLVFVVKFMSDIAVLKERCSQLEARQSSTDTTLKEISDKLSDIKTDIGIIKEREIAHKN